MKRVEQPRSERETNILKTASSVRIALLSIFTALSAVGSLIKIPSPIGSLALDSAPGFFAALMFGPSEGALVCGLGHLATATISGFPLGLLHLPIAFGIALAGAAVGLLNRLNRRWGVLPALVVGVAINTVIVFPLVPWLGWMIALSYVPFLLSAAVLNAVISGLVYAGLRGRRESDA